LYNTYHHTYQKTKSQSIPIKTITLQEAKKVIYGDAYSKDPVSIDKIQEQGGCLYVTISNQLESDESNDTEHIIYIPKIITQQIYDRAYRQQTYLSYGTHQTLQDAVSSLAKVFKTNKYNIRLEPIQETDLYEKCPLTQ